MCQFAALETELLNQIIQKCWSRSLRRKAFLVTALKYEDLIKLGRLEELVEKQVSEMSRDKSFQPDEASSRHDHSSNTNVLESRWKGGNGSSSYTRSDENTSPSNTKKCFATLNCIFIFYFILDYLCIPGDPGVNSIP